MNNLSNSKSSNVAVVTTAGSPDSRLGSGNAPRKPVMAVKGEEKAVVGKRFRVNRRAAQSSPASTKKQVTRSAHRSSSRGSNSSAHSTGSRSSDGKEKSRKRTPQPNRKSKGAQKRDNSSSTSSNSRSSHDSDHHSRSRKPKTLGRGSQKKVSKKVESKTLSSSPSPGLTKHITRVGERRKGKKNKSCGGCLPGCYCAGCWEGMHDRVSTATSKLAGNTPWTDRDTKESLEGTIEFGNECLAYDPLPDGAIPAYTPEHIELWIKMGKFTPAAGWQERDNASYQPVLDCKYKPLVTTKPPVPSTSSSSSALPTSACWAGERKIANLADVESDDENLSTVVESGPTRSRSRKTNSGGVVRTRNGSRERSTSPPSTKRGGRSKAAMERRAKKRAVVSEEKVEETPKHVTVTPSVIVTKPVVTAPAPKPVTVTPSVIVTSLVAPAPKPVTVTPSVTVTLPVASTIDVASFEELLQAAAKIGDGFTIDKETKQVNLLNSLWAMSSECFGQAIFPGFARKKVVLSDVEKKKQLNVQTKDFDALLNDNKAGVIALSVDKAFSVDELCLKSVPIFKKVAESAMVAHHDRVKAGTSDKQFLEKVRAAGWGGEGNGYVAPTNTILSFAQAQKKDKIAAEKKKKISDVAVRKSKSGVWRPSHVSSNENKDRVGISVQDAMNNLFRRKGRLGWFPDSLADKIGSLRGDDLVDFCSHEAGLQDIASAGRLDSILRKAKDYFIGMESTKRKKQLSGAQTKWLNKTLGFHAIRGVLMFAGVLEDQSRPGDMGRGSEYKAPTHISDLFLKHFDTEISNGKKKVVEWKDRFTQTVTGIKVFDDKVPFITSTQSLSLTPSGDLDSDPHRNTPIELLYAYTWFSGMYMKEFGDSVSQDTIHGMINSEYYAHRVNIKSMMTNFAINGVNPFEGFQGDKAVRGVVHVLGSTNPAIRDGSVSMDHLDSPRDRIIAYAGGRLDSVDTSMLVLHHLMGGASVFEQKCNLLTECVDLQNLLVETYDQEAKVATDSGPIKSAALNLLSNTFREMAETHRKLVRDAPANEWVLFNATPRCTSYNTTMDNALPIIFAYLDGDLAATESTGGDLEKKEFMLKRLAHLDGGVPVFDEKHQKHFRESFGPIIMTTIYGFGSPEYHSMKPLRIANEPDATFAVRCSDSVTRKFHKLYDDTFKSKHPVHDHAPHFKDIIDRSFPEGKFGEAVDNDAVVGLLAGYFNNLSARDELEVKNSAQYMSDRIRKYYGNSNSMYRTRQLQLTCDDLAEKYKSVLTLRQSPEIEDEDEEKVRSLSKDEKKSENMTFTSRSRDHPLIQLAECDEALARQITSEQTFKENQLDALEKRMAPLAALHKRSRGKNAGKMSQSDRKKLSQMQASVATMSANLSSWKHSMLVEVVRVLREDFPQYDPDGPQSSDDVRISFRKQILACFDHIGADSPYNALTPGRYGEHKVNLRRNSSKDGSSNVYKAGKRMDPVAGGKYDAAKYATIASEENDLLSRPQTFDRFKIRMEANSETKAKDARYYPLMNYFQEKSIARGFDVNNHLCDGDCMHKCDYRCGKAAFRNCPNQCQIYEPAFYDHDHSACRKKLAAEAKDKIASDDTNLTEVYSEADDDCSYHTICKIVSDAFDNLDVNSRAVNLCAFFDQISKMFWTATERKQTRVEFYINQPKSENEGIEQLTQLVATLDHHFDEGNDMENVEMFYLGCFGSQARYEWNGGLEESEGHELICEMLATPCDPAVTRRIIMSTGVLGLSTYILPIAMRLFQADAIIYLDRVGTMRHPNLHINMQLVKRVSARRTDSEVKAVKFIGNKYYPRILASGDDDDVKLCRRCRGGSTRRNCPYCKRSTGSAGLFVRLGFSAAQLRLGYKCADVICIDEKMVERGTSTVFAVETGVLLSMECQQAHHFSLYAPDPEDCTDESLVTTIKIRSENGGVKPSIVWKF